MNEWEIVSENPIKYSKEWSVDWLAEADKVGSEIGLPEGLFRSLVKQESGGNPNAISPKGAIGLSQLMPGTAKSLGVNPHDPYDNLKGGATYLLNMLNKFKDTKLALAAYNAGPGRIKNNKVPNIKETQDYVKAVNKGTQSQNEWEVVSVTPGKSDEWEIAASSEVEQPSALGKIGKFFLDASGLNSVAQHYTDETSKGMTAMKNFADNPTGATAIQGAGGLAQYIFSPLTAFAKGMVREPVETASRMAGVPEPATQFVGELAEGTVGFVPYGGLVKKIMTGMSEVSKAAEAAALFRKGLQSSNAAIKAPLKYAEGTTPEMVGQTMSIAKTIPERASLAQDAISAAKDAVSQTWKPTGQKRIGQEIIDYISQNREEIPKVLEKYNMTPEELATEFKAVHTEAGRSLWRLSYLAKQIKKEYATNPQLQQLATGLEKDLPEPQLFDRFMNGFKSIESFRRAALTAQSATTFRNIISQAGRLTIGTVDDAFGGAIKGAVSGEPIKETSKEVLQGLGKSLDNLTATVHQMTPAGRKNLTDLLNADNALKAKSIMYGAPIQDVTLGNTTTKILQTFNTAQEFFFRNIAFEAKLEQLMKQAGVKGGIKAVKPGEVPPELLEKAANYSLEMTLAALPKSQFGKDFVKIMSNPVFTALLNPFPRFMWGNALPFLRDFSPLGYIKAFEPKTIAKLALGNPEEFAQAASRATIGTMMFSGAQYLRNSEYAGNNWYEIKVGNKNIDTRAFAPLSSYLFIAEALTHPDRIKPSDFASALFSMNRVAGTGLVLTDIIRGKKLDTVQNALNRIAGEYAGSFTTPLRTPKDIYSKLDPNEAIIRDVREHEVVGPTMRNIPGLSQMLPESVSSLSTGPMKSETPFLRQTTGITYKTKNPVEDELEKLNFNMGKAYPRTGVSEADRKIAGFMQPMVQTGGTNLMNNPVYSQMSDNTKKVVWSAIFDRIRKAAKFQLAGSDPELMQKIKVKGIDEDVKGIITEQLNKWEVKED